MGYELIGGVYKYSESPSKEAAAWQGYDKFPGVDKYENRILKAGTELVKLEPSKSGFFTTREVYEKLKRDGKVSAIALSEGLQVPPWENDQTGKYEYRKGVSMTKLDHDIEVAYGEKTLSNEEFGKGTFIQIYIAGYDGKDRKNNEKFGLKEIDSEDLVENEISKKQWEIIQEKHEQHLLKRNLFCYQKCKDDLITLMDKTSDAKVKKYCKKQINEVDNHINKYLKKIDASIEKVDEVNCPTYDDKNKHLFRKAKDYEFGKESVDFSKNKDTEKQIEAANENLMKKVEGDLSKPRDERNINVDELLKAYKLNKFCNLGNKIEILEKRLNEIDINRKKIEVVDRTIERMEKSLFKAKRSLEIIDSYKGIVYKYENKKIFKKSYQEKHENEKRLYDQAKKDLKSIGINSWKEYDFEKTNFEKLKINMNGKKKALSLKTPNSMELYKKLSPLKNKQINIMKNSMGINKTKKISRKVNLGLER